MYLGKILAKAQWGLVSARVMVQPFYSRKIPAIACGHRTWIRGKVSLFGEEVITTVPVKDGQTGYCHACLSEMAICCAWCRRAIYIGSRVTLYIARLDAILPHRAREYFHEGGSRSFVGCQSCAEMGNMDTQGVWMPPGVVRRIPSATELALQAFRQGAQAVIIER